MTRSTGTSGSMMLRILAGALGGRAHRREVDEQRHAGEILQQHARDHERNLVRTLAGGLPVRERAHVVFGDLLPVDVAQHRFENDADAHRELGDTADTSLFEFRQRVELTGLAIAEVEGVEGVEGVMRHSFSLSNGDRTRRRATAPRCAGRTSLLGGARDGQGRNGRRRLRPQGRTHARVIRGVVPDSSRF